MAIRRKSPSQAAVAALVIAALSLGPGAKSALAAADHGVIRGTLYQVDEKTELVGAKVTVVNVKTGEKYTSEPTGKNGEYEVRGLPPGAYDVVIEVDGTVFVADNLVDLSKNDTVSLDYNVTPQRPANRVVKGLPKPSGSAQETGTDTGSIPGYHGFWGSAGGIALIVVLAAGAGIAISNNGNDNNASPSAP